MPIYEYECASCKKTLEIMQKFSDPPLASCPECAQPVKKVMSRTSFQLKGTGWYATDYKKTGSSAPAAASGTTTQPTEKTADSSATACGKGTCGDK